MSTSTPHDTQREQEAKRKKELKAALTDDKAEIGSLAGAGAGLAAGAAIGSVVPGLGTVVGAAVGGLVGVIAGGVGGAAIGFAIDAKEHDDYWREHYYDRPYAKGLDYDYLGPAYRYGWEARGRHAAEAKWDDVEPQLAKDWTSARGESTLDWDRARFATRDAWDRVDTRSGSVDPVAVIDRK